MDCGVCVWLLCVGIQRLINSLISVQAFFQAFSMGLVFPATRHGQLLWSNSQVGKRLKKMFCRNLELK